MKTGTHYDQHSVNTAKLSRIIMLIICDAILLNLSEFLALLIRFEFNITELFTKTPYVESILKFAPIYTVLGIGIFFIFKLYTSLWEFASVDELIHVAAACVITVLAGFILMRLIHLSIPGSFPFINGMLLLIFILSLRFSYRFFRRERKMRRRTDKKRTMLIGAGRAAAIALRDFQGRADSENEIVCIIDDDSKKRGSYLAGVRIVGSRDYIVEAAKKYAVEEIVIAMPSVSHAARKEIIEICQHTPCRIKVLPGIYQLANGEISIKQIRDVEIEDLLGRDPVHVDLTGIKEYIMGRVVLVTGGGGSIGSELCRQIAGYEPKTLIIFDIYENNAYAIQIELMAKYPELHLETLIGSVRDSARVDSIFETYHPELVFHAAAHKHVPLMEDSPNEAIKNNVLGTLNVALAADKFGAKRMLLISTDKAVNPTNIMGASKRLCEMIVQTMDHRSETEYVAVRFGNVLGSNGSVIPLFRDQIAKGGPVTVTHKDIIRYFMTIPEAVALVLQAGEYAKGGEIFVLDMGKPVRIDDLARNMIKLSGFEPDVDIPIVYTGLRPGEKLFEELLLSEEGLTKTANDLIYIGHRVEFDEEKFEENIAELRRLCYMNSPDIRKKVKEIVSTYNPQ
ncbi:MAG: polysaccharide biosynthesis protein [Christensenellales bacterium]